MKILILGSSGNMGKEVTALLSQENFIDEIVVLLHRKKTSKKVLKILKKSHKKYRAIYGSLTDKDVLLDALKDVDYVINMAAVIPPSSDKNPHAAIEGNEYGPITLVEAISFVEEKQPKLIHISTIGLYGDRNYKHPFAEVGDPLLISPFDIYSLTKMRGEFTVLESDVKCWVVLRQTAMLYNELLMKNISDGLMFHTCFNTPLEWATAKDSAILIRNILKRDLANELNETNFWKHCFNIGGGIDNRVTGYDTFNLGFSSIGAKTEQFFDTNYNSIRNFHGEWYSDFYKLNDLFDYQHDTIKGFWDEVARTHKYFKLAVLVPKKLLKKIAIKRLLKDCNAPYYWFNHNDEARMLAYFNGVEKFNCIPKKWSEFHLIVNNKTPDGNDIDYHKLISTPTRLNHFFDIDKDRNLVDIDDLKSVAEARGGKLLTKTFKTGDIYSKVEWCDCDGNKFVARPHSILFCGHWPNVSYREYAWEFDRLAKTDKLAAQIWYDSHDQDENRFYYYDDNFEAHYRNF